MPHLLINKNAVGLQYSRRPNPYDRELSGWIYVGVAIIALLMIGMFLLAPDCVDAARVMEASK